MSTNAAFVCASAAFVRRNAAFVSAKSGKLEAGSGARESARVAMSGLRMASVPPFQTRKACRVAGFFFFYPIYTEYQIQRINTPTILRSIDG